MPTRLSPLLVAPAVLLAAVGAYLVTDRTPSSATEAAPSSAVAAPSDPQTETDTEGAQGAAPALPPNHPAIAGIGGAGGMAGTGGMGVHGGPHGAMPSAADGDPPAIQWTTPASWQQEPNPSPMRLATYKVADGVELAVTRVGGSVDANVQRWQSQFDGSPKADVTARQVRGLKVTVVHLTGTFLGGGMGATTPDRKDGWAMLAAVVETDGMPYFFKVLGPAKQVDGARRAFDALIASVTPVKGT